MNAKRSRNGRAKKGRAKRVKAEESTSLAAAARSAKDRAAATASDLAHRAKDVAVDVGDRVMLRAREVASKLRGTAATAARGLRRQGLAAIDDQKHRVGAEVVALADAVHSAGERLEAEGDQTLAHYVNAAADGIDRVSDYLKGQELQDMARDVRQFVRDHPFLVFGGCFLAGVALARLLKARPPEEDD